MTYFNITTKQSAPDEYKKYCNLLTTVITGGVDFNETETWVFASIYMEELSSIHSVSKVGHLI